MFKTGLHYIAGSKKLLINAEKTSQTKKYDIKILELSFDKLSNTKKYQLEMVCLDQPNVSFRADFFSDLSKGPKIMIERFNLIQ